MNERVPTTSTHLSKRASCYTSFIAAIRLNSVVVTHSARAETEMTSPTGGARRPRHAIIAGVEFPVATGDDDVIGRRRHVPIVIIAVIFITTIDSGGSGRS